MCPDRGNIAEFINSDRRADYAIALLPGMYLSSLALRDVLPCVAYFNIRRALSVGNYGDARHLAIRPFSHRVCFATVLLEKARLLWFLERPAQAIRLLRRLQQPGIPAPIRLRACDVETACVAEEACLSALSARLTVPRRGVTPSTAELSRMRHRSDRVVQVARRCGDAEVETWARFNGGVLALLSGSDTRATGVESVLRAVPRYGRPHALRRVGLALCAVNQVRLGVRHLCASYRVARDQYPFNLVGLKAVWEAAAVVASSRGSQRGGPTYVEVVDAATKCSREQFAIHQEPVFARLDNLCRYLTGRGVHDVSRTPGQKELLAALRKVSWREMQRAAAHLLRAVFGRAEELPENTPWFDVCAEQQKSHRVLHIGCQVKSGGQTIRISDLPGTNTLADAGYGGYVALSVAPLGDRAADALESLKRHGVVVWNWCGEHLVTAVLSVPGVLEYICRAGGH